MATEQSTLISGLVIACEWDATGRPIRLKISTNKEEDFFVVASDKSKELFNYLQSWVEVRGKLIPFDVNHLIDIEEIYEHKKGETK